jgi:hypothetical protein
LTDDKFMARFEDCTLSSQSFHHSDHVKMAFLYLGRYPTLEAMQRFSDSLVRFAAAKGHPELYHETITWALLLLIRERMVRAAHQQSWAEFAESNVDLLNWNSNVLKRYYLDETLSSDLARKHFLFPDKGLTPV